MSELLKQKQPFQEETWEIHWGGFNEGSPADVGNWNAKHDVKPILKSCDLSKKT